MEGFHPIDGGLPPERERSAVRVSEAAGAAMAPVTPENAARPLARACTAPVSATSAAQISAGTVRVPEPAFIRRCDQTLVRKLANSLGRVAPQLLSNVGLMAAGPRFISR